MQAIEFFAGSAIEHPMFAAQQLVLVHVPDPAHHDKIVPVPGVVVRASAYETMVRIRDLAGSFMTISVSPNALSAR